MARVVGEFKRKLVSVLKTIDEWESKDRDEFIIALFERGWLTEDQLDTIINEQGF